MVSDGARRAGTWAAGVTAVVFVGGLLAIPNVGAPWGGVLTAAAGAFLSLEGVALGANWRNSRVVTVAMIRGKAGQGYVAEHAGRTWFVAAAVAPGLVIMGLLFIVAAATSLT